VFDYNAETHELRVVWVNSNGDKVPTQLHENHFTFSVPPGPTVFLSAFIACGDIEAYFAAFPDQFGPHPVPSKLFLVE